MNGDETDILQRIRMMLPVRWFADVAPVLDGILSGFSSAWSVLYDLLQFVIEQTRITTATDGFLELAAQDYLSDLLQRRPSETDADYRLRLLHAMRRERATRPAIVASAASAGYTVSIFEPAQPSSTGAYNIPFGLAWNTIGGWGSLQMPFESLLVASPLDNSFENELWQNVGNATPAGGALWMHVSMAN